MCKSFAKRVSVALFALAAPLLLGLGGCSKSPVSSNESDNPRLLTRDLSAFKILDGPAYVETIVSAKDGGTVSLFDVELYFPPGALLNDTLIFIDIPDPSVFANNFGTDGLVFDVPVRVVMSYRDAILTDVNESSIKMAWYNEERDAWDAIDCYLDRDSKTVSAYLNHFSAYALISD